jgi:diguanylate cyclase (GGDEF)-like protein
MFDEPTQNVEIPVARPKRTDRKPFFVVYSGLDEGRIIPIPAGHASIGRGEDATIPLRDDGLSRRHAVVTYENEVVAVSDLGSTNGTFVNGEAISHKPLEDGDRVQIGSVQLKLTFKDEVDAAFAVRQYKSSKRDTLTGCYNKRHVLELLKTELVFVKRHQRPLAVLMIDLDHFKKLNDTEGHLAGDAVLSTVGELLRAELRQPDLIARFGGEEFVVVLRETSQANAVLVANRLRQRIQDTGFDHDGRTLRVTLSVGVAAFPEHDVAESEELLELADQALYRAKEAGRNKVSL